MTPIPNTQIRDSLKPAYYPCPGFGGACREMRWKPECGHVPRGFCGATGEITDVKVVLLCAEPGDPHKGENHIGSNPNDILNKVYSYAYYCFESKKDLFHCNVRQIMDLLWPSESFNDQLKKTWITDSVLCSAQKEGGHVSKNIARECQHRYLEPQLKLFPGAFVIALGNKAYNRIGYLKNNFIIIKAYAAAPPGCNSSKAIASWKEAVKIVGCRLTTG